MTIRKVMLAGLAATVGLSGAMLTEAWADGEQFIPLLIYRTGPYAPNGIPIANAMNDYFTLVNERDGGINGVKLIWEECETAYNNDRGVECYERLKDKGPTGASIVNPYSTGITYALIERATADEIPVLSMGYGRTDGSEIIRESAAGPAAEAPALGTRVAEALLERGAGEILAAVDGGS